MRASMCKYVRQNTVITARLIPPVRTLQMKINPFGLEDKVKGGECKKIEEKKQALAPRVDCFSKNELYKVIL